MDWVPEGVQVVNNKGAHAAKAGEFGLMSVLMLHTHMPAIVTNQRDGNWQSLFSTPIAGKTALVVGVGSLGGGAATQLKRLGLEVLGVNRSGRPHPDIDEMVTTERIDDVLPRADYVFVSLPSTPQTVGLFDRRRLERMKPGAGIVNVGRSSAMDYEALSDLLRAGHLSGAIIDVFDPEPLPPESPLWHVPNLVVTPHCFRRPTATKLRTDYAGYPLQQSPAPYSGANPSKTSCGRTWATELWTHGAPAGSVEAEFVPCCPALQGLRVPELDGEIVHEGIAQRPARP